MELDLQGASPALGRGSGPCPAPPTTTGEAGIFPRSHVAATRLVAEHGLGRGHSRGSAGRLVSFAPSRPQTRSKKQSRTDKHTSRTPRTLASAQLPTLRAVSRPSAGHRQPVHSHLRSTPYPSTTKRQLAASLRLAQRPVFDLWSKAWSPLGIVRTLSSPLSHRWNSVPWYLSVCLHASLCAAPAISDRRTNQGCAVPTGAALPHALLPLPTSAFHCCQSPLRARAPPATNARFSVAPSLSSTVLAWFR